MTFSLFYSNLCKSNHTIDTNKITKASFFFMSKRKKIIHCFAKEMENRHHNHQKPTPQLCWNDSWELGCMGIMLVRKRSEIWELCRSFFFSFFCSSTRKIVRLASLTFLFALFFQPNLSNKSIKFFKTLAFYISSLNN